MCAFCLLFIKKSITLSSRRPISTMAGVIKHTCTRFVLYLRFVHILITYYIYHSTYTNEYISLYPCTCVQCHISYNLSFLFVLRVSDRPINEGNINCISHFVRVFYFLKYTSISGGSSLLRIRVFASRPGAMSMG